MRNFALITVLLMLLASCYYDGPPTDGDGDGDVDGDADGDGDGDICEIPASVYSCVLGVASSTCSTELAQSVDNTMFLEFECGVEVYETIECNTEFSFIVNEHEEDGCFVGIYVDGWARDSYRFSGDVTVDIDCGEVCTVVYPMLF